MPRFSCLVCAGNLLTICERKGNHHQPGEGRAFSGKIQYKNAESQKKNKKLHNTERESEEKIIVLAYLCVFMFGLLVCV